MFNRPQRDRDDDRPERRRRRDWDDSQRDEGMSRETADQVGYGNRYGRTGTDNRQYTDWGSQQGPRQGQGQNRGNQGQGAFDRGMDRDASWGSDSSSTGGAAPQGRYSGRGPKGYQRSDERIMEEVNDRLTWSGEVDATNIEVRVQGGEVTLEGSVEDRQQKREAEEVAYHVQGVRDVHNRLRVQQGGQGGLNMGLEADSTPGSSQGGVNMGLGSSDESTNTSRR